MNRMMLSTGYLAKSWTYPAWSATSHSKNARRRWPHKFVQTRA